MFQSISRAQWYVLFLIGSFLPVSMTFAEASFHPICNLPPNINRETLVGLALQCSATQKAISSRWQAQQKRAEIAGRLEDPTLMIGAAPRTFGDDQFDNGYILEFKQSLPWPNILSLREQTANAQTDVWQARFNQNQVVLARDVRLVFSQWQYHFQLLDINRQHQQLWQEFMAIVRIRYAAGTTGKSAVLQASHEHHLLLQEAIELNAKIERNVSQLKRLVNLPTNAQLNAKYVSAAIPDTLPENAFSNLLGLLNRQPVMKAIDAQRRKKANEIALAEKDRYPSFSIMTRYNSLWMNEEQRWVVGVGFNLPFDSTKRSSQENSLKAEQNALHWEQQDLMVRLREQLTQAFSFWQQANKVHQLYQQELLPLAEESLITARIEYQSGVGNFLSLLTAQRQALSTQRKAQLAIRDHVAQFANLTAAAGMVYMNEWNSLGEQP